MCDILNSPNEDLKMMDSDDNHANVESQMSGVAEPNILTLPVEVFLKICSFLDADFISLTLSKVCSRFEEILTDVRLWRYWVNRRIKNTYPAMQHLSVWAKNEVNWEEVCIEIDKESKKWTNVENNLEHIVVKDVHFASVDTVLLVNNAELCISGGRDRSLALWRISDFKPVDTYETSPTCLNSKPVKMCPDAHTGWVWDLAVNSLYSSTVVYSASWDHTVKAWDMTKNLQCIQTLQCSMCALSVVSSGNLVLAGLYSSKVLIFDVRTGPKPISSYRIHKGSVLALDTRDGKVTSASEDKTLAVYDINANKVLVSDVKMPNERAYPVSLSWSRAALYIGDSKGNLHLFDPEQFVYTSSHEVWPEPKRTQAANKISGIHQGLGSMIVCSDRGEIKFLYNSYPPEEYTSLRSSTIDITKMEYENDILVIGTCDCALEFWIPRDRLIDSVDCIELVE